MTTLLTLLRRAGCPDAPISDGELLDRFARSRDEPAFAELVRRHGPVVYRICRRLIGPAGADDAFQSTFLVLATRPRAARASATLGGWLAGVAGRVARQMRRGSGRRAHHESAAAAERPTEWADREAEREDQFRALDEELTRLPEALRAPIVLCLLQGYTQDQAAAELGRDPRTLRRRLERAKAVLRARLERRGVVPTVAGALVSGAGAVSATPPPNLVSRTVALVFDFLTGGPAHASPPVVLAKGVATTMYTRKLVWGLVALALGAVGLGAVMANNGPPAAPPAAPTPLVADASPAKAPPAPVETTSAKSDLDWAQDEVVAKQAIAALKRDPKAGPTVVLQSLWVHVPMGFCDRVGLTPDVPPSGSDIRSWQLNPREARMLKALLSAEHNRVVTHRHSFIVADGKIAFAQVGEKLGVLTEAQAAANDNSVLCTPQALTLRFAPKLRPDGFVELKIASQFMSVVPGVVDVGGVKAAVFNEHSLNSTVALRDGETFVRRSDWRGSMSPPTVTSDNIPTTNARDDQSAHEQLLLVTCHIARGPGKNKLPQPAPVLVAPPPAEQPARP